MWETVPGIEVVQLYLRDRFASMTRPVKELAGFKRIHMEPGEKVRVTFTVQADQSAFLDRQMRWKVEKGKDIDVEIGSSSEDIRLKGTYRITEDKWIRRSKKSILCESTRKTKYNSAYTYSGSAVRYRQEMRKQERINRWIGNYLPER